MHRVIVVTAEIAGIMIATLLIALLILSVILVLALTLALVVGKEANGRCRTNPKQRNQELPSIHVSPFPYLMVAHDLLTNAGEPRGAAPWVLAHFMRAFAG